MIDFTGHILNKYEYNEQEQTLSLTIDGDKVFLLKVEGDCCSTGKFTGVSRDWIYGLPQRIVEIKDRSESFRGGEYQVYETTFVLENGEKFSVTFDNESNGYYGSTLESYYNDERLWSYPAEIEKKEK